ncbi:MAG: type III-A CRISPR-associated RAMP protein Csm4 [Bacteroidia bacterium]|nr:type III-A CRISPR-associated RAMP protein Csm4 [Bacteroidia bacterium]MDW8301472.1 type III-A CRISPR-associated RAMP protein Csm4 [Bacteroidia bacterium]
MGLRTFTIFKLYFETPLHIATPSAVYDRTEEFLHSDKMYAAFVAAWAMLGIPIPTPSFSFAISSLFPFYENSYLFPKPFSYQVNSTSGIAFKKLKKIKYVDSTYLQLILQGQDLNLSDENHINDSILSERAKEIKLFEKHVVQRVKIEQTPNRRETMPFYLERLYFHEKAGLYFIFEGSPQDKELVRTALRLLSDEGIGTDRNVGNGFFTFEETTLSIELPQKANRLLCLGMFLPENQEQLQTMLENAEYELKLRGGYISTPPFLSYRKRFINMFSEGSVFSLPEHQTKPSEPLILGGYVDLEPDIMKGHTEEHSIIRIGKTLFLPFYQS